MHTRVRNLIVPLTITLNRNITITHAVNSALIIITAHTTISLVLTIARVTLTLNITITITLNITHHSTLTLTTYSVLLNHLLINH